MGVPYRRIADQLGCSIGTVSTVVQARLAELQKQIRVRSAEIRAAHLLELQHLRRRLAAAVAGGDVKAITAWLRVQERESRLLGLDLQVPSADESAQHGAATVLLQTLADHLDADTMDAIVGILSMDVVEEPTVGQ